MPREDHPCTHLLYVSRGRDVSEGPFFCTFGPARKSRQAPHNREVTVSTIYRILESFRSANILSFFYHPDTGKCYYDITVAEHHHLFDRGAIEDYADPELSHMIREYLERKHFPAEEIGKIQVQVTLKKSL